MKRFSFGSFEVCEDNRRAFDLCQEVAELRARPPQPLVLLGDKNAGKTHLLYSIVNRVRAASARAGIAYVTAKDFPQAVRNLIRDPAPVERASHAVLLVDHLESFREHVEELETVVRIFMDFGHSVVVATSVHPDRLLNLTRGLRDMLDQGSTIEIAPRNSGGVAARKHPRLEENREKRPPIETVRRQFEVLERMTGQTAPKLEPLEQVDEELVEARAELHELHRAVEELRAENAQLSNALREMDPLRHEIAALREAYEATRRELDSRSQDHDKVAQLEARLIEAVSERGRDQAQMGSLLGRAEVLLEEVQRFRIEFGQLQEEQARQVRDLRQIEALLVEPDFDFVSALEGVSTRAEHHAGDAGLPEPPASFEEYATLKKDLARLSQERDGAIEELARERAESSHLREALMETKAEKELSRLRLKRANEALGKKTEELENFKLRAAEESAEQVQSLEREMELLREALRNTRAKDEEVLAELAELRAGFSEAMEIIGNLERRFGKRAAVEVTDTAPDESVEAAVPPPAPEPAPIPAPHAVRGGEAFYFGAFGFGSEDEIEEAGVPDGIIALDAEDEDDRASAEPPARGAYRDPDASESDSGPQPVRGLHHVEDLQDFYGDDPASRQRQTMSHHDDPSI